MSTWYWQNYEICRKWRETHKDALLKAAYANSRLNTGLYSTNAIPTTRGDSSHEYHDSNNDKVTSEIHHSRYEQEFMVCDDDDCDENEYESNDSQMKFEVDQDFLEFLEISMKHKQELKEKRMKESKLEQNQTPNQEKKNEKSSGSGKSSFKDDRKYTPAPDCPIGKMRLEEMKLLYGSAAQRIQGMETALQLSFNRKCDSFNPLYWPTAPFNLKRY